MPTRRQRKGKGPGGRKSSGPRISVCMIARDEAVFVEPCLKSVRGLADEIVLVDTGSEDATPALAERLGAKVLHLPWEDDFSAPRNASIDAASGDWILLMDCDEVIASRDLGLIRRTAVTGGWDGYLMTTRNYVRERNPARWVACRGDYPEEKGYEGWFPTTKVRLFRNDPRIRFRGAVHEMVEQSILEAGGRIGECAAPIHHYGYMEKARGPDRYLGLAEIKVRQEPENPKAFYELASVYGDLRRYAEGIQAIERTIALVEDGGLERHRGSHLEMELVFNAYGSLLDGARRHDEAIRAHERALTFNPRSYQALNNMGSLYERKGDLASALAHYERAHALAPEAALVGENMERVRLRIAEPGQSGVEGWGSRNEDTPSATGNPRSRMVFGEGGRLSVCLIVKDGEATLGACLDSVAGLADEIVVVDTGSSDRTVEIARQHGARVDHFAWCDDFAAARNASLRMATGDWILWMDADDVLPEEERAKVRKAVARAKREAYYFVLENIGADRSRYPQMRLFPNLQGVEFERPVHEQVTPSLDRLGVPCLRTDIRVVHTGYTTPARTAEKRSKYLGMMRRWLETHPEDADVRFRVGHTLLGEGDARSAEGIFAALVAEETLRTRRPSIARMARTFLGRSRLEQGRPAEGLGPLREAVDMAPDSPLSRLYLGECYLGTGQPGEALRHLEHALVCEGEEPFFPVDKEAFRGECERLIRRCRGTEEQGGGISPAPLHPCSPAGRGEGGRLSLTMIVKNEEARLGRCLESVQGLVDEIVVVDTGSTDDTVAVARRYGARIHYFEWCEDWSAARNEAIRHATGDWVMWLDADDVFPRENFPKVREAMKLGKDHAFYFRLEDEGLDAVSCLQLRMFPNVPGVCFEMPVHEQVSLSLCRLGMKILPTDIVVRHTGYTTPEVVRAKQERYFRIVQRWLETHPDDYIVRHHEAQTHYVWGELDEAIADYRQILEDGKAEADRNWIIVTTAHLYIGRSLMRKGEYEQALKPLKEALRLDDHYAVTHLTLGECYLKLDRVEEAVRHLEAARRYEDQVTFAPNDPKKVKALTRLFLGQACEARGDVQEAVRHYEAAEAVGAAEVETLGPLSTALRKSGRKQEARSALERALERHPGNPNHAFNLGVMALEEGDLDRAEELFTRAAGAGEGLPHASLNLGFIAKKRGAFDRAELLYRQAAEKMADPTEAEANLGHLYASLKRWPEAAEAFKRVRERRPGLLDVDLGLAAASAHTGDMGTVLEALKAGVQGAFGKPMADGIPGGVTAPEMAQLFSEVGRMLITQKQIACAAFAYETARTLDPALLSAALALAEVLKHTGEVWKAIEVYEDLIQAGPSADLFRKLGECYRQLGSDEAAQACDAQAAAMEQAKGTR